MTAPKPRRQKRGDRLIDPFATQTEMEVDYALGPFDRRVREMDRTWGVDRLPELVSPLTAQRWGKALAQLNAAIDTRQPEEVRKRVEICLRGLEAMNAEAEATNAPKAQPGVIEIEMDGFRFGILTDDAYWPAVQEMRPDLTLYSLRQIGMMVRDQWENA